jgi:hypothetical protein
MTVALPETVGSYGNASLVVLASAPSLTAPTITVLEAGEAITCHVYGTFASAPTQTTGSSPRKMCQINEPQRLGSVTYTINDIQYSYNPQELGTPGAAGNEAFEALTPGTNVWLVERVGISGRNADFTAGELVNIYPVECGVQRRGQTGDGEFDEFSVTQSFVLVDGAEPSYDAVVTAP